MPRAALLLGLLILAVLGVAVGLTVDSAQPVPARTRSVATAVTAAEGVSVRTFTPASFRFAKPADRPTADPVAPVSLTASDGTGLALVALKADGVLEPPLAFTELHLTFENPRNEVIEGRFEIALPPGAALSRFAMKIGDAWQEGEVVERQRARRVYEDFLHRRQDPALLEQEAGNRFSARVFPIPARARKELIVAYSHGLARQDEPYVLPLLGLSEIGRLDIRMLLGDRPARDGEASNLGGEVRDRRVVELSKRDWTPDRDFVVRQDKVGERVGLRHGNLAVVRVTPEVDAEPQEIGGLYVLIDSSASRALGYRDQVRRLAELVAGLRDGAGASTPLGIAAFDQVVVPIFEGTAGSFGRAEVERLGARRPLGASNLEGALAWLADRLAKGKKYPRVLLITDGVATAGETETRDLKAAVRALGKSGVERLDVLAVGGLRDDAVLAQLTTGNLEHDGKRLDGTAPLEEVARRLTLACRSGIEVQVPGAGWVWPQALDGVQSGDEVLVYADLPAGEELEVVLGGQQLQLERRLVEAERPLLERAWAQARIDRLLSLREIAHAGDDDLRSALVREVTELSIRHRVLSPFTALLVLETEADYRRFGIERRALADILTVGPGGLEVLARRRNVPRWAEPEIKLRDRRAFETGRLNRQVPPPVDQDEEGFEDGVMVDGIEAGLEGGVADGVPGGTAAGVAGGVVGRAASGAPSPPAARPAPMSVPESSLAVPPPPAELEAKAEAGAPLRVGRDEPFPEPRAESRRQRRPEMRQERRGGEEVEEEGGKGSRVAPYSGRFAEVMEHLAAGRTGRARAVAEAWQKEAPGDVLALLALGETWEAAGEMKGAARAYGSLIDLFPSRADLRRLAGERLERLGEVGLGLAVDTYRKAVAERPDHPSGHRLLAWALLRTGRFQAAFEALEAGIEQPYPGGRFRGVDRILRQDLGLLAAAWLEAEPARRREVLDRLEEHGATLADEPSLRFVLTWETDANDVDLHVYDRKGGHASYSNPELPSGGRLVADVTTGYGPECFAISGSASRGGAPYRIKAHYYRRGPMGYGMGTLQVVRHDGRGRITVEPRPFVVMVDNAWVDLGRVGEGKAGDKAGR